MKKFLGFVLCLVMVLSLAACSDDTKDAAKDAVQDAKESVEDAADTAKKDAEAAADEAKDAVKDAAENAADEAKDAVKDAAENAADAAKDAVEDAAEDAADAAKDAADEGLVGVANPVVDFDSLETVNDKIGCNMARPAVMGVTDETYSVIGDVLAQYRFTVGGYNYCLRCQGTMDDICGIYGDDGTLFEGKDSDVLYAEGAGYKVSRWFTTDGQYVLSVNDNGEMSEEQFLGIAAEIEANTRVEDVQDSDGIFAEINGAYQDTWSGRASAVVESTDDSANISIVWGDSAADTYVWIMNVTFEDGKFVYNDCYEGLLSTADDGTVSESVISENGSGYFTYTEGKLVWDGAADENCRECIFEKIVEQ